MGGKYSYESQVAWKQQSGFSTMQIFSNHIKHGKPFVRIIISVAAAVISLLHLEITNDLVQHNTA